MTLLSLVMIVRDAEDLLPGLLAHHRGLADEMLVGDTGSTDGSAAAARAAGATVLEVPWRDDFAAARNAVLAEARGRWALLLDADEKIAAADFARLRAALAGAPCAFVQEARNYVRGRTHVEWQPATGRYPELEAGYEGYFVSRRIGVFPVRPDIRFSGRVHESVLPAVEAAGLPLRLLDVPVHHYGYVLSDAANRARSARYRRLAELKVRDAPDDPAARLEWATALIEAGRAAEAVGELELAARGPADRAPVVRARTLLGRLRREAGDPAAGAEHLEQAVAGDPTALFAWLELIRCRADQDDWPGAAGCLAAARAALPAGSPLLDREELRVLVKTGRLREAAPLARRLVETCPQWTELTELARKLARLTGGEPPRGA